MVRSMPAAAFKARCLKVMDEVERTRKELVITKRGVPVAKIVPVDGRAPEIFDCMTKTARIAGDVLAPLAGADDWEAIS